jgi:hypothetical protein
MYGKRIYIGFYPIPPSGNIVAIGDFSHLGLHGLNGLSRRLLPPHVLSGPNLHDHPRTPCGRDSPTSSHKDLCWWWNRDGSLCFPLRATAAGHHLRDGPQRRPVEHELLLLAIETRIDPDPPQDQVVSCGARRAMLATRESRKHRGAVQATTRFRASQERTTCGCAGQ